MYIFGITALLGLAVMAVAVLIERYVNVVAELWALLLVVLGIIAAWLADFSMFASWHVPVRANWIGILLTGLAIAGFAHAFYLLGGVVRNYVRKMGDEAESLEKEKGIRRVA